MLLGLSAAPAYAGISRVDNVSGPIVRVNVRRGDVTIQTWDRPSVEVDGDPSLLVTRRTVQPRGDDRSILIPPLTAGSPQAPVQLPPESFVVSSIPPGPRDVVVVHSTSAADVGAVTVHVPADSVFVFAHAGLGDLAVHDYKAGTLVGFVGRGRLTLDDVGGTVFAQTNRGPLVVRNSNFDRIRARSLLGNMTFERCNVRQIEATSVKGSIVYDDGSFQPGLARFESTSGNVAIGTTSAAQLGARTAGGGRVFTDFSNATRVDSHGDGTTASVGGGGPVVTATSETGNVFLYNGSLRTHAALAPAWHAAAQTLNRPARRAGLAQPLLERPTNRDVTIPRPRPLRQKFALPPPTPQTRARTPAPTSRENKPVTRHPLIRYFRRTR